MVQRLPSQGRLTSKTQDSRKSGGFTLVEVIFASTVLIFGLCSCFGVLQQSFSTLDTARSSTLAAQVMQSEIERLRLMNWSDISALTGIDQPVSVSNAITTSSTITNKFSATRTIGLASSRPDMLEITITVRWNGTNGMQHSRTFMTRYSKNGLNDYFYTSHS